MNVLATFACAVTMETRLRGGGGSRSPQSTFGDTSLVESARRQSGLFGKLRRIGENVRGLTEFTKGRENA